MSIKLNGSNSGSVELDVLADAGLNTAITFPATSGEVIISDTNGDVDLGPLTIDGAASDGSVNIDSSGRLLVGTPSLLSSSVFQAKGTSTTSSGYGIAIFNSAPSTTFAVRNDGLYITGTESLSPYNYTTASAANMVVNSSGYLQRSTSSLRFKKNIETLEDKFADEILKCRPVWYQSKSDADVAEWGYWGFIAEEVEKIDPRLCFYGKDEEGNLRADGVQYDRFVPHLLNLIKRQKEQIEAQGTAIAALEARLTALEGGAS